MKSELKISKTNSKRSRSFFEFFYQISTLLISCSEIGLKRLQKWENPEKIAMREGSLILPSGTSPTKSSRHSS